LFNDAVLSRAQRRECHAVLDWLSTPRIRRACILDAKEAFSHRFAGRAEFLAHFQSDGIEVVLFLIKFSDDSI